MKVPTDNELALDIIKTLAADGNRPGEGLPAPALLYQVDQRHDDFQRGLDRAQERGWIEVSERGFVKITQAGFDAA